MILAQQQYAVFQRAGRHGIDAIGFRNHFHLTRTRRMAQNHSQLTFERTSILIRAPLQFGRRAAAPERLPTAKRSALRPAVFRRTRRFMLRTVGNPSGKSVQ